MVPMVNPTGKHRPKKRHHGDGTIIKRVDHWRAEPWQWVLRGVDENGKRRVLASCSGASKAECESRAKALLRELDNGASVTALTLTVADQLDRWLDGIRHTVRKPRTYERYRSTVTRIKPAFADLALAKADMTAVKSRLAGTPSQRDWALTVLRMACRAAVAERLIAADPTFGIARPPVTVREAPTVDPATAVRLLEACQRHPDGPLVAVAITMGLRRGELIALRWADVDLTAGALHVDWNLQRLPVEFRDDDSQTTEAIRPKNHKTRLLPLSAIAADALERQRDNVVALRRAAKVWAENDLVFPNANGEPMHPNTATRRSEALIRSVIPGDTRLHDMRSAWETLLASGGVGEHIRMKLAGHSTIGQTMAYTKVVPEDARLAVRALDERLAR